MAVKTSPRRTRSTFKKQSGSYLTMRPKFQLRQRENGETEILEKRRPSGGLGYIHNKCMCKSCRGGRV